MRKRIKSEDYFKIPLYCACECGEELIREWWWKPSDHPKYIKGHWIRGDGNPRWIGGKVYDSYGYVLVLKPDHPFANNHGYVREHRLVYEEFHKCYLLDWAVIHHKNNIKDDNRIENLEPMTQSKHASDLWTEEMTKRILENREKNKRKKNVTNLL